VGPTSRNTEREMKVEAKMEDLWKFNLLMFAFAILLGYVFMYLAHG
jgi:hypothetical protein